MPNARGVTVTVTAAAVALVLVASGCGAGVEQPPEGSQGPGAITSVDEVDQATVRIQVEGAFVSVDDLGSGEQSVVGFGSGFIIDPTGLAVTNNHVVTGASRIEVYVGESSEPVNARVLGVSECSDLAVLDIDGDGFPFLGWTDAPVEARRKVFSAGFPGGEPEFTITEGIVNVVDRASGTTGSSFVAQVIEHSARIRGGNSGGPLVGEDGSVIGVNYAGDDLSDYNLAINATEARGIVDQLRQEVDVDSIGVNGVAVSGETGDSGVFVQSVETGSPAQRTGVRGGDLITRIENTTLAEDGTLSDYCGIIRSHDADDVLKVEVLRTGTGEVLAGELNGRELEVITSFEQQFGSDTAADPATAGYGEYTEITDDAGAVQVSVPAEWTDVDGAARVDDQGNSLTSVAAASDLTAFLGGWDTPGTVITAVPRSLDVTAVLDAKVDPFVAEGCRIEAGDRQPFDDGIVTGLFDVYGDCGGVGATYIVIAATPADGSYTVVVEVQVNADRDFEALDQIIGTFQVVGQL